jgi:ribose/xylose/arabinose/galactoside ABC-type transport system permease subunit
MTAVARAFSRLFFSTSSEFDVLKTIALLCGVGLLVSLLMLSYGLDLSPGFF